MKRKLVIWIAAAAIVIAAAGAAYYVVREMRVQRRYRAMAEQVSAVSETFEAPTPAPTQPPAPEEETPEPSPTPEPTPEPVSIPVDFPYYREQNEDIVGWIEVEGTDISYFVLYDSDEYYLTHTWQYDYSSSGSIFMQDYNRSDFSDFNTVLYGHNMASGAMFAQLHRFENSDFFDEHDTITVYTPDSWKTYRIFAAYRTDNLNIMANNDFSTEEGREAYIESIYDHSYNAHFDDDIRITADDRIITLSTCIGNADYRYVVQGVLVDDRYGVCE